LIIHLVDYRLPEFTRRGDEDRSRIRTMLGLADKITGHDEGIGSLIGYDRDLRWSRQQVDADLAE
jgi:hypothetical protein